MNFTLPRPPTDTPAVTAAQRTDSVLVVDVVDLPDAQALLLVKGLLVLEDPLVEKLLQLLIAVVDAELLEAVHSEVLCRSDMLLKHVLEYI